MKFSGSPLGGVRRIRALATIHECLDAVRAAGYETRTIMRGTSGRVEWRVDGNAEV